MDFKMECKTRGEKALLAEERPTCNAIQVEYVNA